MASEQPLLITMASRVCHERGLTRMVRDIQPLTRLAGPQVEGVCRALLALQLNIRDLGALLLACPALLACEPAALTAQAGPQPLPSFAACMPGAPLPSNFLSCAHHDFALSLSATVSETVLGACYVPSEVLCLVDQQAAWRDTQARSYALLEQANCVQPASSLRSDALLAPVQRSPKSSGVCSLRSAQSASWRARSVCGASANSVPQCAAGAGGVPSINHSWSVPFSLHKRPAGAGGESAERRRPVPQGAAGAGEEPPGCAAARRGGSPAAGSHGGRADARRDPALAVGAAAGLP